MTSRASLARCSVSRTIFVVDALGLDVELDRGDAVARAADLEVHVAEVVFLADDVGEQDLLVALLHEADRDAGDRLGDRHAGVHQREAAAAARWPSSWSRWTRGCR